jgi:hypothetical protein
MERAERRISTGRRPASGVDRPPLGNEPSLDAFNAAVRALPEPMVAEFDLDVSGVFVWRSGENPPGGFILEKVWRFEQANAPPRPVE